MTRTFLVMEYAGGGELYGYIRERGKLPEQDCKPLFSQIVAAVAHMVIIFSTNLMNTINLFLNYGYKKRNFFVFEEMKLLCLLSKKYVMIYL